MPTPPAKPITKEQAATTLAACGGNAADRTDNAVRIGMVAHGVNSGYSGADIANAARMPASVGQCVADAYDTDKKPASGGISAWAGGLADRFKAAASDAAASVGNKIEASLQAAQPGTNAGVTARGASLDQFCATVEANGGSARDVNIAMQKCDGPKARAPGM